MNQIACCITFVVLEQAQMIKLHKFVFSEICCESSARKSLTMVRRSLCQIQSAQKTSVGAIFQIGTLAIHEVVNILYIVIILFSRYQVREECSKPALCFMSYDCEHVPVYVLSKGY